MRDKEFKIGKNLKYCRYKIDLVSVVYNFFEKNSSDTCGWSETLAARNKLADCGARIEIMPYQE